jgi:hypothetical protein
MLVISACCGNTAVHKADREVKEHATDYPDAPMDSVLLMMSSKFTSERIRLFSMLSHGPSFCNPAM